MNLELYRAESDDENTNDNIMIYNLKTDSDYVNGDTLIFEFSASWDDVVVPKPEILTDEATGDSVYLKLGQLERRIDSNEDRLVTLENQVASLQSEILELRGEEEVTSVPIEKIKEIIVDYVEKHGDFWPDELAFKHNLSVWDVLDAVDALAKEGFLEAKNGNEVPRKI